MDNFIELDEDGWQVFPEGATMNSASAVAVPPTFGKQKKRVAVATNSKGPGEDPHEIIEVDGEGWQVLPTAEIMSNSSPISVPPKVKSDKDLSRNQEPPKSSNGTMGRAINAVRREWWNTPAPLPPASSTSTAITVSAVPIPECLNTPSLPSASSTSTATAVSAVPIPVARMPPSPPRPLATLPPFEQTKPTSVIDPSWELIDPNPDVHALFVLFNATYFWDKLGTVTVDWSSRMTTCAGLCYFKKVNHITECRIKLSLPLLKLRPRKDLVETLLHEMIHAYLFLEPVRGSSHDRDGHGPNFQEHMHRINKASGAHITIYHSFHDEVGHYQQHWWQCNGPCRHRHPYYGLVKRAMNRAPGPSDRWWAEHGANCDGVFIKVREPPKVDKENKKRSPSATSPAWSDF